MGVLGAPVSYTLQAGGAIRSTYRVPEPPIYLKKGGLPVPNVLTMGSPYLYKAAPIRFFKFVWGLPAGTEDPQNEVGCCYGTRSPLKNIRVRGRIIFLFFSRAARALKIRQISCTILKVPDGALVR